MQLVHTRANYRDELTQRNNELLVFPYYGQAWQSIAWCQLRNGYRDFRLSRVQKMNVTDQILRIQTSVYGTVYSADDVADKDLKEVVRSVFNKEANMWENTGTTNGFVSEEVYDDGVAGEILESVAWIILHAGYHLMDVGNGRITCSPVKYVSS